MKKIVLILASSFLLASCGSPASSSNSSSESSPSSSLTSEESSYNEITFAQFKEISRKAFETYSAAATDEGPLYQRIDVAGTVNSMNMGRESNYDLDVTFRYDDYGGAWVSDESNTTIRSAAYAYVNFSAYMFASSFEVIDVSEDNLKYYVNEDNELKIDGNYIAALQIGMPINADVNMEYKFNVYGLAKKIHSYSEGTMVVEEVAYDYTSEIDITIAYSEQ